MSGVRCRVAGCYRLEAPGAPYELPLCEMHLGWLPPPPAGFWRRVWWRISGGYRGVRELTPTPNSTQETP